MVLLSLMNSSTLPHKPGFQDSLPSWVAGLYYIPLKVNTLLRCGLNRIRQNFPPSLFQMLYFHQSSLKFHLIYLSCIWRKTQPDSLSPSLAMCLVLMLMFLFWFHHNTSTYFSSAWPWSSIPCSIVLISAWHIGYIYFLLVSITSSLSASPPGSYLVQIRESKLLSNHLVSFKCEVGMFWIWCIWMCLSWLAFTIHMLTVWGWLPRE